MVPDARVSSSPSFLRALPAKLESTRTRAESLGGTSTTHSPAAAKLPARCRPRPPALSTAQLRSGNRFAQRLSDLRPARFCGKLARSTNSPTSSTAATATPTLCGDRPRSRPSHERRHLRFSRILATTIGVREGHSDFERCSHTSFESLRTPRSPAGHKPRISQPILRATGSSRATPVTGALEA